MPKEENGARGPLALEPKPVCPSVGSGREDLDARPEGMDPELAVEAGAAPDAADGILGDGFASPAPMAGDANRRKLKQTYRARHGGPVDDFEERIAAAYRSAEIAERERAAARERKEHDRSISPGL